MKSDKQMCIMTGDATAVVNGYGGARAFVNLPCTYRASRFVVRQSEPHSFCGVEIHVTNELQRDNYVARAVHVAVGITESARQVQTNTDVMVTGTFNNLNKYDYVIRAGEMAVFTWGSTKPPARQREDIINVTVQEADNMVVVDLPTCGTQVKFRAYDKTRNVQQQLPGVSVAVPKSAEFVHEIGDYPFSLCGGGQDSKALYKNRARSLHLSGTVDAIIWDVLLQRPQQIDNPEAEQCQRAMDLMAASANQKSDLKACSFLLSKKRLRSCLNRRGMSPLDVFNSCLSYQQMPSDALACEELRKASSSCKNLWNGPAKYSC